MHRQLVISTRLAWDIITSLLHSLYSRILDSDLLIFCMEKVLKLFYELVSLKNVVFLIMGETAPEVSAFKSNRSLIRRSVSSMNVSNRPRLSMVTMVTMT